ncbi:MAG: SOS response-associated peptidase [Pseudomonadota bacterium]
MRSSTSTTSEMCGRFALGTPDPAAWSEWLGLAAEQPWPEPSWNVAPTHAVAIVGLGPRGRSLRLARWGLVPPWWQKPLAAMKATTFNARSEEAWQKPMFREAWARRRGAGHCLIPALGYFEWSGGKGAKQAWFVGLDGNAPGVCFAGLWALTRLPGVPEPLLSCTILTCPAGPATAAIHPRTPVMLAESEHARWLSPDPEDDCADLMRAPPDDRLRLWPVSPRVGRVAENDAALIEPVAEAP